MIAEREEFAAIAAARSRLIEHSRAHVIEYDDDLSEATPVFRTPGEPRSALPPTFGLQSVFSETSFDIAVGKRTEFVDISREAIWLWYRELRLSHKTRGHMAS